MSYAPCRFCGTVTPVRIIGGTVCGTCEIMLGYGDQGEHFEVDQRQLEAESFERSVRENEAWDADADLFESAEFLERLIQHRLYSSNAQSDFRHVSSFEEQDQAIEGDEEEEFSQNDEDNSNFNLSYQENVQLDQLSARPFDRGALTQRLIRVLRNNEGNVVLEDDVSQLKGATESDIAILNKRSLKMDDPESNVECAICTEKFDYVELTKLPCNHEYHSECIQHWLKLNATCPICRQSISSTFGSGQAAEQEADSGIILFRRDAANLAHQNTNIHFLDDVD